MLAAEFHELLQTSQFRRNGWTTEGTLKPGSKSKPKTKNKRQPGGQVGHPGHHRKLVEPSRVSETVVLLPEECHGCGTPFTKAAQTDSRIGEPYRHQVLELPPIKAHVIGYQLLPGEVPSLRGSDESHLTR